MSGFINLQPTFLHSLFEKEQIVWENGTKFVDADECNECFSPESQW